MENENVTSEDLTETEQELLRALAPRIDGEKILIDILKFREQLENMKTPNEKFVFENEMLGLSISLESKLKSIGELRTMAHESLSWMLKNTPTRRPLGVD